jgi:hypothetical protein
MGAKSSTAKGLDLNVTTYALAEAGQRASGMAVWTDGKILIGQSSCILQLDLTAKTPTVFAGKQGIFGASEGKRLEEAQFQNVADLLVVKGHESALSSLFVIDSYNCKVRLIENDIVSTYAGTGEQMVRDGPRLKAAFFYPVEIVKIGPSFFISDTGTHCIRIISPDGMVSTLRNEPNGVKWRWKSLISPSERSSSLRASNALSSSSDSHPKYQSLKHSGESHQDIIFDESPEGLVKFGNLKAIASSHPDCQNHRLYVSDEVKKNGRTINRLLRFDLELKEVEILMASFVKDKSTLTVSSSSGKVYEGGKVVSKDLTAITGLLVASVTEQGEDELIMATDRDRHAIFSIRIKEGDGGSMMKIVGKDTEAHGGHKDGSLKVAKLESPSRPSITPHGHLIWIDGNDKGHSRIRCVKGFAHSITTLREEMRMFLARQQAQNMPPGTDASSLPSTPSKDQGTASGSENGTPQTSLANSDENVRNTVAGCLFRPSASPSPSTVANPELNSSTSSFGGSLDSSSFYSITSTSPPPSQSHGHLHPYQAHSAQLLTQGSSNQRGKSGANAILIGNSGTATSIHSTSSSQYGIQTSLSPPTSPSIPSPFLVTKPSSMVIPPHQPSSPRLQQHHEKPSTSNSTDSIPYFNKGETTPTRSWTSGNSGMYSAHRSPSQQHLGPPTHTSPSGGNPFLSQSTGIPSSAVLGLNSSMPLSSSSASSISSLTSSTQLTSSISLAASSTATVTSPTAPLSIDSISTSSSGNPGSQALPMIDSPSQERLAHHRQRSRPDLMTQSGNSSPTHFSTATSPRSPLAASTTILAPSHSNHEVVSLPSNTFSLNPFDLESNWTLIEPDRPSSPYKVPLSSSPH